MKHLDMLMTGSEPGDTMHHLHVIAAKPGAVGPLGLIDESALHTSVYAIAPDETVDAEQFITKTAMAAFSEHHQRGEAILFAALAHEAFAAPMDDLGRTLLDQRRLEEHPQASEITQVYAVCRDGRRWRGRRYLTGPRAGEREDVTLLVGVPIPSEGLGRAITKVMLHMVGLRLHPFR